jgi:hypothetical protein
VAIDRESRRFTRCSDDDKSAVGTRLILHPGTDTLFPNAAGRDQVETPITVAVGPEGGFTEDEVRLAFEAGFEAVADLEDRDRGRGLGSALGDAYRRSLRRTPGSATFMR